MLINIDELRTEVLKNLDENEENLRDRMQFGQPDAGIPELIDSLLPDEAAEVMLLTPLSDIDEWEEWDAEAEWISPGSGSVRLPSDFLRMIVFRMSDWKRSVSRFISPDSEEFQLRFSPGLYRRNLRKAPAAAICAGSRRGELLFIGSSDPGACVERFGYLPRPDARGDGELWIPRSLRKRVAEAVAARIRRIKDFE